MNTCLPLAGWKAHLFCCCHEARNAGFTSCAVHTTTHGGTSRLEPTPFAFTHCEPVLVSRQRLTYPRIHRKADSVALEGRIRAVKDLKAETLEKILEAERQVMLWEKKTQLERETQVKNSIARPRTYT